MGRNLAIGIGAVVAVLVIVFCILPLKEVSYEGIEKYQAPETYYALEPYTELIPYVVNEPHTVQVRYTEQEPYTVWQKIYDPITHEVIGHELVTKYRTVVKYRSEVVYGPVTKYREVTLYRDAAGQTQIWQERPATQYKKVSLLEALIGY